MKRLSLTEAAHTRGQSVDEFRDAIDHHLAPAPSGFTRDEEGRHVAYWWQSDALSEAPRSEGEPRGAKRSDYLTYVLDELRWWRWAHENLVIAPAAMGRPRPTGGSYPIGSHVAQARNAYRLGKLSADEVDAFEALPGWAWDHTDSQWRDRFTRVLSAWPDVSDEDRNWLNSQRRRYRKLRPTWRALLDEHPNLTAPQAPTPVETFHAAAKAWLEANPERTMYSMPYNATIEHDGQTYPLGRRATYYRRRWAGLEGRHPLSDDDVQLIESLPGWDWDGSPSHRLAALKRHDLQHLEHIQQMRRSLDPSAA